MITISQHLPWSLGPKSPWRLLYISQSQKSLPTTKPQPARTRRYGTLTKPHYVEPKGHQRNRPGMLFLGQKTWQPGLSPRRWGGWLTGDLNDLPMGLPLMVGSEIWRSPPGMFGAKTLVNNGAYLLTISTGFCWISEPSTCMSWQ